MKEYGPDDDMVAGPRLPQSRAVLLRAVLNAGAAADRPDRPASEPRRRHRVFGVFLMPPRRTDPPSIGLPVEAGEPSADGSIATGSGAGRIGIRPLAPASGQPIRLSQPARFTEPEFRV